MVRDDRFDIDPQKVKEDVQSGEYFSKARNWYDELYHRPLGERSYFILITCFSALTIWLSSQVYFSMFPLNPVIPYIILSENIVDEYPTIRPLRVVPAEDLNVAMARFLVSNYVEVRENYHYDVTQLEWNFNRIRSTSEDQEFNKYQRSVNPQNPASPFNKYGRDMSRNIYISNVALNLESEPRTAQVTFTSHVVNGNEVQTNYWSANITFRFPALTVDQETNKVLQWDEPSQSFRENREIVFKVVDYATQELTQY